MKNISIILPLHTIDGDYLEMFNNAVSSVETFSDQVKLVIVGPKKVTDKITKEGISDNLEIDIILNDGETDFVSQINLGIEKCGTEWFSILEVDDQYTENWLKNLTEYINENPSVDVFLPIVKDLNVEGKFLNFTNESVWAYGFSETQGFIDNELLLEYQNYQTSGGLYRTSKIIENGSFKENIKLTFCYEFLLRLTHNEVKIMVVPKIGYQHVNFREDSLFWSYKNDESVALKTDEAKFWLETAKKEFFFKNKREVSYVD